MPKRTTSKLVISSDRMSGTSSRKFHATTEANIWNVVGSKKPSKVFARRESKEDRSARGASRKRS